jgi:topoisomerase-4 subunit A
MTATAVVQHHAKQLVELLSKELEFERKELQDKMHLRTLERLFIEEKNYKTIEALKTTETIEKAVLAGFTSFAKAVGTRGVSHDDVEHLLRIPIRRISLFDINKAKAETREINARVKEINTHLQDLTGYATSFLDGLLAKIKANAELNGGKRKTKVGKFEKVAIKELVKNVQLKYDRATGYLGTAVNGELVAELSPFDRVLSIRNNGVYAIADIPEKTFLGENAWWIGKADKETLSRIIFTIIYKESETSFPCIKRCVIEGWIMNRDYSLIPEGATVLHVDTRQKFTFTLHYTPRPRVRITKEVFDVKNFPVKGLKTTGTRLAARETERIEVK